MNNCVFCKIARGEIKTELVYQNETVIAFKDIHPVAPVHLLIIPRQHIEELYKLDDAEILSALLAAMKKLIVDNQLVSKGYKIEVNGGGAQIVNHLHFHLIGPVSPPKE